MNLSSFLSYKQLFFLSVLLWCVSLLFCTNRKAEVVEVGTSDTITIEKIDTFVQKEIECKYITKRVFDTLYIKKDTVLYREQKHYGVANKYDAWISGIDGKLDSIKTYNQTKYETITNEITREVYKYRWNYYLFGGLNKVQGVFSPKVGITITAPKKWLISGEIGLYENKPFYGLSFGLKLNDN